MKEIIICSINCGLTNKITFLDDRLSHKRRCQVSWMLLVHDFVCLHIFTAPTQEEEEKTGMGHVLGVNWLHQYTSHASANQCVLCTVK